MNVSPAKLLVLALAGTLPMLAARAEEPVATGRPLVIFSPNAEGLPAPAPLAPPAAVTAPAEIPLAAPTGPAPTTLAPATPAPAAQFPAAAPPAAKEFPGGPSNSPRFEMEELSAPDPDGAGVLAEDQGGFGRAMWKGIPAAEVRSLIPTLPAASGSRVMQSLARRLLLSTAIPPEGNRGLTPPLMELRAERLYAMGAVDGLGQLLKAAPASVSSPGLSRIEIDTWLLAGDTKSACEQAAIAAQGGAFDPRLSIFCQISAGKVLEAGMALDLMREGKNADHAFIAAAEALSGTPPAKVTKLPDPTPLHLAMFKAAKMPLPADAAANAPPAMLRAMADNPALAPDQRIVAAEKAEALGILDTGALRKLMDDTAILPAEEAAIRAQGDKTPRGRALWLRAVTAQPVPTARAGLITQVLAAAAERHAFAATARLYAPLIADLTPSPELAPSVAILAHALYAAELPEPAGQWLEQAKATPDGAKQAAALWPLARVSRVGLDPSPPNAFASWLSLVGDNPRRAVMTMAMLQAVGEAVPASALASFAGAPAANAPKPVLRTLLRAAAEGGRRAEAVLLSAAMVGETGLDSMDSDALGQIVAALRQVGLEREARQLAVEAILATGG